MKVFSCVLISGAACHLSAPKIVGGGVENPTVHSGACIRALALGGQMTSVSPTEQRQLTEDRRYRHSECAPETGPFWASQGAGVPVDLHRGRTVSLRGMGPPTGKGQGNLGHVGRPKFIRITEGEMHTASVILAKKRSPRWLSSWGWPFTHVIRATRTVTLSASCLQGSPHPAGGSSSAVPSAFQVAGRGKDLQEFPTSLPHSKGLAGSAGPQLILAPLASTCHLSPGHP